LHPCRQQSRPPPYYKNLYCPTKTTRVAVMPNADSQRVFDCFLKVRSVLENGGRVVCATATPVSNTMAEVYVCMKYLQLETLQELGNDHFDAWVQQFAETTQSLEITPDGARQVTGISVAEGVT